MFLAKLDYNRKLFFELFLFKYYMKIPHHCTRPTCSGCLLKRCIDLFVQPFFCIQTAWSWTLLHHAAYCGRVALLRPLVEMGADPNVRATDGRTPIYVACYCGRKEVAVALAALGADPTLEGDKVLNFGVEGSATQRPHIVEGVM